MYGLEYPFGQLESAVLPISPLNLLPMHSLLAFWMEVNLEKQILMLRHHCSAVAKTLLSYQQLSGYKYKAQHCRYYWMGKSNSIPDRPSAAGKKYLRVLLVTLPIQIWPNWVFLQTVDPVSVLAETFVCKEFAKTLCRATRDLCFPLGHNYSLLSPQFMLTLLLTLPGLLAAPPKFFCFSSWWVG